MMPYEANFKRKPYSKVLMHFDENFKALIERLERCADRHIDCDLCPNKEACIRIFDIGVNKVFQGYRTYTVRAADLEEIETALQNAGCM